MSKTIRKFPDIKSKAEFFRAEYLVVRYGTYEKYLNIAQSDKMMRRLPPRGFRRIRVRHDKIRQNHALRAAFKHGDDWDNLALHLPKRTVPWEYF